MSTYLMSTKNPKTGVFEMAEWVDDYFGRHNYGVRFSDGKVYNPDEIELETDEGQTNPNPIDEIYPSWQKVSLTKAGYIYQRIEALTALKKAMEGVIGADELPYTMSPPRVLNAGLPEAEESQRQQWDEYTKVQTRDALRATQRQQLNALFGEIK